MTTRIRTFSPLGLLALAACGSDSNGSGGSGGPVIGNVVKGPLANALVFADENGDRIHQDSEASARTGSDGGYSIDNPNGYTLVVTTDENTIDSSSGQIIAGLTMKAGPNAGVITPLTGVALDAGDTAALAAALGLPTDTDFATFNPYGDDVDPAAALAYEQVTQSIMASAQIVGAALEANGDAAAGAGLTAAFNAIIAEVTAAAEAGETEFDAAALTSGALEAAGTLDADVVAKVAAQVAEVAEAIDAVEDLNPANTVDAFSSASAVAGQYDMGGLDAADADVAALIANNAPTDVTLDNATVEENESGAFIGALTVTDADGAEQAFTYVLGGADADLFTITRGGDLYLVNGIELNFEEQETYDITVTATDAGGKSVTRALTVTATGVDEATEGEYDADGGDFSFIGDTLTVADGDELYGMFTDDDNTINGGDASDFASHSYQWTRDGDDIAGATDSSYTVTEDDLGANIEVVVTLTDQQGNTESGTVSFGEAFAEPLIEVEVGADVMDGIEGFKAEVAASEEKLGSFADRVEGAIETFNAAVGDDDPDLAVTSSGITASWATGATLSASFTNFNPTSVEGLIDAVEGFDIMDTDTWAITGGFNNLTFSVGDEAVLQISHETGDANLGERIQITLPQSDSDDEYGFLALTGDFDNTLTGILGNVKSVLENDAEWRDVDALWDAVWVDGTFDEDAYDAAVAAEEELDAQSVGLVGGILEDYAVTGLAAGTTSGVGAGMNLNLFGEANGEDAVSFNVGMYELGLKGELPDSAADLFSFVYNVDMLDMSDMSNAEVLDALAEEGFGGITGVQLINTLDDTPIVRVSVDDFGALVDGGDAIDFDGDFTGTFTNSEGAETGYVQDNDGLYALYGDAADIAAFMGDDLNAYTGDQTV
ncbi:cadherin domain-containing protein [Celeribacter marinus]|uniref:cadherin domain-containing protein n=1 Tax=Celeribacter marinus TaxID=1397108 RepID=UPI003F6BFEDE